jgi:hypothetical protein
MTRKINDSLQVPLPLTASEAAHCIVGAVTLRLRNSAERQQVIAQTSESHEAIEKQLAQGPARQDIATAACAYLLEQLPGVLHALLDQALSGNASACKIALEMAGFDDYAKRALAQLENSEEYGPFEQTMLRSLREQIESMPDRPDPLDEP